ncbi:MAG TPA: ketoisovalerate oxidoreductase, partial [Deltaproteobacteria bacterium]|nr:ketoisovalerate oxidoreductase [Deltaproteobacteria bacterium]
MKKEKSIEIRWHGRGGQGAITAAKIVAKALFDSGYTG